MRFIPIIGFVYEAVRCMWALHQLKLGLMTLTEEWEYFQRFNVALLCSAVPLLATLLTLNVWALSRRRRSR